QEVQYDPNGNPIVEIDRQRFDDATATGALGDAGTNPKARVYYIANYFDKADRLTEIANYGTNGAASWSRLSTAPSASDTILATIYGYNAAGWLSTVTDPAGNVTQMSYDRLGRVTETIAAYTDGTPTTSTNQK